MNEGRRWKRKDRRVSKARPGPTFTFPARQVRAAMAVMVPPHTPGGARGAPRARDPPQMGHEGLERDPWGSAALLRSPLLAGTKAGGGTCRQLDSAGRSGEGRGWRHLLLKVGLRAWRALHPRGLWQRTHRLPSGCQSPLRVWAGTRLPLAKPAAAPLPRPAWDCLEEQGTRRSCVR